MEKLIGGLTFLLMPSYVLREITSFLTCVESSYLRSTTKLSRKQSDIIMA